MTTIENFISSFIENESFNASIININDEIKTKFNHDAQLTTTYIGGFDSPGYSISCSAYAFIDERGILQIRGMQRVIM